MATPQNSPYINFPGNAAEVMTHFRDVFGGELEIMTYADFPEMEGMPFTPPPTAVAHSVLTGGLLTLTGGDAFGEPDQPLPPLASEVYSFLIGVQDVEEGRALIEKMVAAGGQSEMPFELAPWGDHYGTVRDRFGAMFAVVCEHTGDAA